MKKAFTMIELVFVIVVIGILAAIAVPKFAATRDDATVTRASSTLASIRSAIAQEAQRRQMEGNYTLIKNVGGTETGTYDKPIFDFFDTNSNGTHSANATRVLEYPIHACKNNTSSSCWIRLADGANDEGKYLYKFVDAVSTTDAPFIVKDNRFECNDGGDAAKKKACRILER